MVVWDMGLWEQKRGHITSLVSRLWKITLFVCINTNKVIPLGSKDYSLCIWKIIPVAYVNTIVTKLLLVL